MKRKHIVRRLKDQERVNFAQGRVIHRMTTQIAQLMTLVDKLSDAESFVLTDGQVQQILVQVRRVLAQESQGGIHLGSKTLEH
ncbi:hypothetical protein ACFVUS_12645 [Nocardia sp. NPDC058058]|uniref:hypothetical protein n=1 Tax=Nocardia sp. NPDC058058 TaxID=3346317 RepID=UPI0036DCBD86